MTGLTTFLKSMPERHRWKVYVSLLALFCVLFIALLVVDLWRGGDAGEWIKWIAGAFGIGGFSLAAANTNKNGT